MIFDKSFDVINRAMDLSLVRQTVISDNIANAETPFYKARRVDFEKELARAIALEDAGFEIGGVSKVEAKIYDDPLNEIGNDLNSVDMDREMSQMTKNDLKYSAMSQSIAKKFSILQYAIGEGRDK